MQLIQLTHAATGAHLGAMSLSLTDLAAICGLQSAVTTVAAAYLRAAYVPRVELTSITHSLDARLRTLELTCATRSYRWDGRDQQPPHLNIDNNSDN